MLMNPELKSFNDFIKNEVGIMLIHLLVVLLLY